MNERGRSNYSACLTIPSVSVVPRTMTVRLTDAALHGPVGRAAIPSATAVIVIIVPVAAEFPTPLSAQRNGRAFSM
jgi:hypothetical protein